MNTADPEPREPVHLNGDKRPRDHDPWQIALVISNIVGTLIAGMCAVVLLYRRARILPPWAEPSVINGAIFATIILVIPLSLIWFPKMGQNLPWWVTQKTFWIEAYMAGWFLLLLICGAVAVLIWPQIAR